jgi:hypothetical protein
MLQAALCIDSAATPDGRTCTPQRDHNVYDGRTAREGRAGVAQGQSSQTLWRAKRNTNSWWQLIDFFALTDSRPTPRIVLSKAF